MERRNIYVIVLASIIILATFSAFIYARTFSEETSSNDIQEITDTENSKTKPETKDEKKESYEEYEPEDGENAEVDTDNNIKYGKVNVQVYYSAQMFFPNIPVQFAVVKLESEDGTIQRQGFTNFRGRTTFRFLPTDQKYIVSVIKNENEISGEFIEMNSDIKANYEVVFF